MKYLKYKTQLIELWENYCDESLSALIRENNPNASEVSLLTFDELTSTDKIRALGLRLDQTTKQLTEWRNLAIKMRENLQFKIPHLHKYADGYRLGSQ